MNKMSDEAKEAQRKYLRQWRMRNPDKVAKYVAAYWERKARQQAEISKKQNDGGIAK